MNDAVALLHHAGLLDRMVALRSGDPAASPQLTGGKPLGWRAIAHELDLSDAELMRYRWMRAAELKIKSPHRPWSRIAADPSVDLKADTLKKNHSSAKLPTGQTWSDYVGSFARGLHERLSQLQAEKGAQAAEDLYSLMEKGVRTLHLIQDNVEDHAKQPPKTFVLFGKSYETCEQLEIDFGTGAVTRQRTKIAYHDQLLETQVKIATAAHKIYSVMAGTKPVEDDAADSADSSRARLMSPEELAAQLAASRALDIEIEQLQGLVEVRASA